MRGGSLLEQLRHLKADEGTLNMDAVDNSSAPVRSARHNGRIELPATVIHGQRAALRKMGCHDE